MAWAQGELEGEDETVVRRKSRKRAWEEEEGEAGEHGRARGAARPGGLGAAACALLQHQHQRQVGPPPHLLTQPACLPGQLRTSLPRVCMRAEDAEAAAARRAEAERERDRQEKEEFEQRLREKDEVRGRAGGAASTQNPRPRIPCAGCAAVTLAGRMLGGQRPAAAATATGRSGAASKQTSGQ